MIDFIWMFFEALWNLSNAMAPYILFGLFFAGILHELVPDSFVAKHLGKSSVGSVIKATLFGIPLPVCSCGVIPLATSIKKSGASNGSTLSFLISTPITGVDSILATYGMFGWAFMLYRVISSMIISIIAGIFANVFVPQKSTTKPLFNQVQKPTMGMNFAQQAHQEKVITPVKKPFSLTRAFRYAFVTLLGDIASPLLVGLLLGALITVAIPANLSEILIAHAWLSYFVVIAIAVPMYVCATASLPIAAGLMLAGVSPGAAFVFLSAGPATNTVTMGVVKKMLGTKTLYIYLSTIILGSMLFGFGLDYVLKDVSVREMIHMDEHASMLAMISTLALWTMIGYLLVKPYFKKEIQSCCSDGECG